MEVAKYIEPYVEAYRRLAAEPELWLKEMREAAITQFALIGFPETRQENWRHTELSRLTGYTFATARDYPLDDADIAEIQSHYHDIDGGARLVFVNGWLHDELSTLGRLPDAVVISSLSNAREALGAEIDEHLANYACYDRHAFIQLNTAFMTDGLFLKIPDGVELEPPVQLIFYSKSEDAPSINHPRNLIILGKSARATVVETYIGSPDAVYLANPVTEIDLAENAALDHYKIQLESGAAFHMATIQARQARDSRMRQTAINNGALIMRNDLGSVMIGEGGDCKFFGLYLPQGEQHMDTHSRLDHAAPHCTSTELYKGVLDDRATGVFNGKIDVRRGAQKTDAVQSNHALLLTDEARVNARPQLEIYADDVKCTHGATAGEPDTDALYYLQTRGIDKETAKAMIIAAFASEIIEEIAVDAVRERIQQIVWDRFLP
ncbi:Fe-S cluster assembly protein SufD [Candidatus Sumerlaeota bacterium]|nr:Fe-S cluster assembly protein SufD [Candidatus Sumerlaeota bacterium]